MLKIKFLFNFANENAKKSIVKTQQLHYKRIILFLFYLLGLYTGGAQSLPLWENRVFQYNRYNFGVDFYNTYYPLQVSSEGGLFFSPEPNRLSMLGNTQVSMLELCKGKEAVLKWGLFQGCYRLNGRRFYAFDRGICMEQKKGDAIPIEIAGEHTRYRYFTQVDKSLFFTIERSTEHTYTLMHYDGVSLTPIETALHPIYAVNINNRAYSFHAMEDKVQLHSIDIADIEGIHTDTITYPFVFLPQYFITPKYFYYTQEDGGVLYRYLNGVRTKVLSGNKTDIYYPGRYYSYNDNNTVTIYDLANEMQVAFRTTVIRNTYYNAYSGDSQSIYIGTSSSLARSFSNIRIYPRLFNGTNSDGLYALTQSPDGRVWIGSYNGGFSILQGETLKESAIRNFQMINGATPIGNKVLFHTAHKGLYLFSDEKTYTQINDTLAASSSYLSQLSGRQRLYVGYPKGIAYKEIADLENKQVKWQHLGGKKGMTLDNPREFTEDKEGNLWVISLTGLSVYDPKKDRANSYLYQKDSISLKGFSIYCDDQKRIWLGTDKGQLYYYKGKDPHHLVTEDFERITHPLFTGGQAPIVAMNQWRDNLIVGTTERIMVLSLADFRKGKLPRVRVLNPQELSLRTPITRRGIIPDIEVEGNVWIAALNVLYKWNIERWLSAPTFQVEPSITVKTVQRELQVRQEEPIRIPANENTIEITLDYQSRDNLPRYMLTSLIKKGGDSSSSQPQGIVSTETQYHFANLSSGKYIFSVWVCQSDGTVSEYKFPIEVEEYIWQNPFLWVIVLLIPMLAGFYLMHNLQKIDKQEKEIALLNLATLGKQFRPHFMLNALNSLGAELYDKPHAERILSHIGENINIMHQFSKEKSIFIPFAQEWKLTENTIAIQKEIFLPELEVKLENFGAIPDNFLIPMGLLQVIVENSLLHGLRHRREAPYVLRIAFWDRPKLYGISVTDNGVGVENSKKYEGVRHGTGLKNLERILKIINKHFPKAITIDMNSPAPLSGPDCPKERDKYPGTLTIIQLKKDIDYERI